MIGTDIYDELVKSLKIFYCKGDISDLSLIVSTEDILNTFIEINQEFAIK